jgi:hypothetical protein
MLAVRLIPSDVMAELRVEAAARLERPSSRAGLIVILAIWVCCIIFIGIAFLRAR